MKKRTYESVEIGPVEQNSDTLAEMMRSFSDPVRLRILSMLMYESDYCLNIAKKLGINVGNTWRHLITLYESGFLLIERRKMKIHYSTNLSAIFRMFSHVQEYIYIGHGDKEQLDRQID